MLYPMSLLVRTRTEVVPAELPPVIPAIDGDIVTFAAETTKEISAVTDWVILKVLTIACPILGSANKKIAKHKMSAITLEMKEFEIVK